MCYLSAAPKIPAHYPHTSLLKEDKAMLLRKAADLFLDGYFSTHERSPRTVAAYTTDLEQFLRSRHHSQKLEAITPEDLEAWAQLLKNKTLAPASIRRKLAVLKIFFNYWVRRRVLDRSPLWLLRFDIGKIKPLTRTLTPREMGLILRQARTEVGTLPKRPLEQPNGKFIALRNWAIVELLLATGIRVGEATALLLEDLTLDQRTLLIRGKGGRQRLALLTEDKSFEAVSVYHQQRLAVSSSTQAFLLNRRNSPLSAQGVSGVLRELSGAAGIQRHITPHMLRHTAATFLLHNGADIRIVQEFLGHASITTTQRYTHVSRSHLQAALKRSHPRMGLRT
jgi:site-specific recombinase XerD